MLLDLPAHDRHDVVEVLGHDAGDADFESVAATPALIDQIVGRTKPAGAIPGGWRRSSPDALHAPFERRCAKVT